MQEQARGIGGAIAGVRGRFKDNSFEAVVEEAIQHWTKMWMVDAEHDAAVAFNVKVAHCHLCSVSFQVFFFHCEVESFAKFSLSPSINGKGCLLVHNTMLPANFKWRSLFIILSEHTGTFHLY